MEVFINFKDLFLSVWDQGILGIDIGFWHGMSKSEICSALAGQTDGFWLKMIVMGKQLEL